MPLFLPQMKNPLSQGWIYFLQIELAAASNIARWMYYAKVPDPFFQENDVLDTMCNKAIKSVRKEHMNPFHKRLLVYDLVLGPKFSE